MGVGQRRREIHKCHFLEVGWAGQKGFSLPPTFCHLTLMHARLPGPQEECPGIEPNASMLARDSVLIISCPV